MISIHISFKKDETNTHEDETNLDGLRYPVSKGIPLMKNHEIASVWGKKVFSKTHWPMKRETYLTYWPRQGRHGVNTDIW
jgi:hypothetical protein